MRKDGIAIHCVLWMLSVVALLCIILIPNIVYAIIHDAGISYIITSTIFALPIIGFASLIHKRWIYCILLGLITIFSIIDLSMVDIYRDYLLPGGIISTIKTNNQEAREFYLTNINEILRWIPLLLLAVCSGVSFRVHRGKRFRVILVAICLLLPSAFVTGKIVYSYDSAITLRYYVNNRILNRPPYNVIYQTINAVKELNKRKMILRANLVDLGAQRDVVSNKEVYILAIGESLRYDNLSLNGVYPRSTTPKLERMDNLLLFHDYYSQACLTMYSVPQLITRATPEDYDLSFQERSIIEPFRECGFKTYTIVSSTNLLAYEKYLSSGVDSLIIVSNVVDKGEIISGDKSMAAIVDSLITQHDKVFIMMQFYGNHSFFTNYEPEFDVYKPNINTCTEDEKQLSDSLLINAYDNSILYTDYILESIINAINKKDVTSAMLFVSDHGEYITKDGAGHGGNCKPYKEEYHVPLIFWWSEAYDLQYPEKVEEATKNTYAKINGDNVFYSVCDMADIVIDSIYNEPTWSIFSSKFKEHTRFILMPDGKTTIQPK